MKQILEQPKDFWQSMLGKELYEKLLSTPDKIITPPTISNEAETNAFLEKLHIQSAKPLSDEYGFLDNEVFAPLFKRIIQTYLEGEKHDPITDQILENPSQMLKSVLFGSIRDIPMRVCIYDMQLCKHNNELSGDTPAEEYDFYCSDKLSDGVYVWKLCADYPELTRLLYTRLSNTKKFITEIARHIYDNKSEIVSKLCDGKEFSHITVLGITGSDCHDGSKKTVRCNLDNQKSIIYKPHCLKKEIEYHKLYSDFCAKMSLDSIEYPIIDGGTYGIAKCFDTNGCENIQQAKRYFRRMGIHLFLCYLLSAGDIHQENILASGEYPILVDAETVFGIQKRDIPKSAEDKVNEKLSWTVLKTGILPIPIWRVGDKGVIISALHSGDEAYSTVKLPIIKEAKTSNMYVAYDRLKIDAKGSLPTLNNEEIDPAQYTDEIQEGFLTAGKLYIEEKDDIEKSLECFKLLDTRYLIRHTQQYTMYISSSTHPVFLKDTKARLLMLQVLQKNNVDTDIIRDELAALMDMDTPLLTCRGDETVAFYGCSAYDTHMRLAGRINSEILNEQRELIKISMELIDFAEVQNKYFRYSGFRTVPKRKSREDTVSALRLLIKQLKDTAVVYHDDICWSTIRLEGENIWNIEPLKMNLYDGMYGMAVLFALADKYGYLGDHKIYNAATDALCRHADNAEHTHTGLFVGAGSLIYTFLLLYKISGDKMFIECAEKQIPKLENIYTSDTEFDLLSGNAGAITALSLLYEVTGRKEQLALAEKIGGWLWEKAVKQDTGYGWNARGNNKPLSGMSHGSSGFITAYSYLLKNTHDDRYVKIIDSLIAYENTMYCEKEKNWKDLRIENGGGSVYANAWCHGAAGILLSRIKLEELDEYRNNAQIKEDIKNAAETLFAKSKRKGLCLCHGMAGNYIIMKLYERAHDLTEPQRINMEYLKDSIVNTVLCGKMLVQDKYFTGLMTGRAGIAVCLMEMLNEAKN